MADDARAAPSLKAAVSEAEWRARVDLAALYRLAAIHRWDDMIFTHISARIPGPEHEFLINPYGYFFEEITASSLIRVGLDGKILQETSGFINPAGFTIHSAIHAAREDANFVIHLHSDASVAVSAQRDGLMPLTQHAMIVRPHLAYHDYEGVALNHDERSRIVADLGDKHAMLLRNHGALTLGPSAGAAWVAMFFLERACVQQVMALSAGRDGVLTARPEAEEEVRMQTAAGMALGGALSWPACLRRVERESPGYDA